MATLIKENGETLIIFVKNFENSEEILAKEYGVTVDDLVDGIIFKRLPGKKFIIVSANKKRKINDKAIEFLKNQGVSLGWRDRKKIRGIIIYTDQKDVEFCKNAPSGWYVV